VVEVYDFSDGNPALLWQVLVAQERSTFGGPRIKMGPCSVTCYKCGDWATYPRLPTQEAASTTTPLFINSSDVVCSFCTQGLQL
jgi:hypothetical protein